MKQTLIYMLLFFNVGNINNSIVQNATITHHHLITLSSNVRTNGSLIDAFDKQTHMRINTSIATDNL